MSEELPTNVSAALNPETFDVLEFITARGLPVDDVLIYTDSKSVHRLSELAKIEANSAARAESDGLGIADEVEWVDPEELAELQAKVLDTALTFKLESLAPAAKEALRKSLTAKHGFSQSKPIEEQEAYFEEYTHTLIAKSIRGVVRPDGSVGSTAWTPEAVESLRERLDEEEFKRLDSAVYTLNFHGEIYDRAVSADFLSKR